MNELDATSVFLELRALVADTDDRDVENTLLSALRQCQRVKICIALLC
jgi:hypothetical protein